MLVVYRCSMTILFISLLGLFVAGIADAGVNHWTTTGPKGANIAALAIDPNTPATIYAGTDAGVFKSPNGGADWTAINTWANVKVSSRDDATSGTANVGPPASTTTDYFTFQHAYRIRQDGTVTGFKFYVGSTTNLASLKIKVWTPATWKWGFGPWTLVGTSQTLGPSDLTQKSLNTITLSTPITGVREGDFIGYTITSTSGGTFTLLYGVAVNANSTYYFTSEQSGRVTWTNGAGSSNVVYIEAQMTPPQYIMLGDSITSGHGTGNLSLIEIVTGSDIQTILDTTYENYFCRPADLENTGSNTCTFQNMGIGGDTTEGMVTRLTRDVLNLTPSNMIILAGVNDIATGVNQATYIANYTSILNSVTSIGIKPYVIAILPWTSGDNIQLTTRDSFNSALQTLVSGYAGAVWVDCGSQLGQYRSGGAGGNYWDLKPAYNADGTHLNAAGNQALAACVAAMLHQYTLTVTKSGTGSGTVTSNTSGINCGSDCNQTYNEGTDLTLTVTPASGLIFGDWSGDAGGLTNLLTITMNGNKNVTANFIQNQSTLTVNIVPTGSGSVTKSPDKATYVYGDMVQLTATANPGYTFNNWSGDAAGSPNPVTVTMNVNKTVTANFGTTLVTPTAYDFGNVKVKRSKTASFKVTNNGKTNLSILTSTITGPDASMFTIASGSGAKTIKPGKSLTIKVAFKPTSKGAKNAKLEIASNDPVTPTDDIALTGTGQ